MGGVANSGVGTRERHKQGGGSAGGGLQAGGPARSVPGLRPFRTHPAGGRVKWMRVLKLHF